MLVDHGAARFSPTRQRFIVPTIAWPCLPSSRDARSASTAAISEPLRAHGGQILQVTLRPASAWASALCKHSAAEE